MASSAVEMRVLGRLLDKIRNDTDAKEDAKSLWVPQMLVAAETPLDVVRGVAAKYPWPDAWEARLRALSPKSEEHSWLYGAWLNIAGRWTLYECIPQALIPKDKLLQLSGTPYWNMPKQLRAGRKQAVTAFQWEMYRVHKVWARPFWVLQGPEGGTPAQYSEMEESFLQAKGLPTEPPAPGELPYAPFDGRVEAQIISRDRLIRVRQRVDRLRASGDTDAMKAETVLAEEEFRKTFWAWWKDSMEPQAEYWAWYTNQEEAQHLPVRQASRKEQAAAEETEEMYLTTGNLPVVLSQDHHD